MSIGVSMVEKRELTEEEYSFIENSLAEQRYLKQEYVLPRRIETTSIKCPWCSKLLMIEQYGNSYSINCADKNCLHYTVRGI